MFRVSATQLVILKGQKDDIYMKKQKKGRQYTTIKWRLRLCNQSFEGKGTLKSLLILFPT